MTIFGIGTMEILVILVLAFILLGPNKMVEFARLMGKAVKEVRRISEEIPRFSFDQNELISSEAQSPSTDKEKGSESSDIASDSEGPVNFKQVSSDQGHQRYSDKNSLGDDNQ